jgi:hypothetical protein
MAPKGRLVCKDKPGKAERIFYIFLNLTDMPSLFYVKFAAFQWIDPKALCPDF